MEQILKKFENVEFQYGKLDCFSFVCSVIKELTGRDYAAPFRERYDSEISAIRLVRSYGSFIEAASAAFGGEMKPFWMVREGDPVLLRDEWVVQDGIAAAFGIFDGDQVVYLCEDDGLAYAPITAAKGCWNV